MLEDEAGDEIKIGAWNMDDLSELEGQKVTLKRNMTFKDDGEYQSVELGKNTKIIEEGAAEESPSRKRKSAPRENKGKTTSGKSSDERGERMHWGLCLKVAGTALSGWRNEAGEPVTSATILEVARDLYSAVPGSNGQDKVRKFVKKALKEPEPEPDREDADPHRSDGTPDDDDDDVSL